MYRLTTKRFCAAVSVVADRVQHKGTAPCYQWAAKKKLKFPDLCKYYWKKGEYVGYTEVV